MTCLVKRLARVSKPESGEFRWLKEHKFVGANKVYLDLAIGAGEPIAHIRVDVLLCSLQLTTDN